MISTLKRGDELKNFVQLNSYLIYKYINSEILKDIGEVNSDYFINTINSMFTKNLLDYTKLEQISLDNIAYEIFPYFLLNGKIDYTSLRIETIDLTALNIEASVYYNYARFSIKEDILVIELMQTKIGGMPIDNDIVKYTKNIEIKKDGLSLFIENFENSHDSSKLSKRISEMVNII